jgi:DNA invertase Pin-like site-specific DNA recombinase
MIKYKVVAIYLRKSREDRGEVAETREETLARHRRILLDYCKKNNLIVKDIFEEVVSGENLEARPQARKMLENVSAGLYEGVVVIELERLSRGNQIDQVEITKTFKERKTKIYTLNKVYDLSSEDSFDEDFFEFGLFMSRREYKTISRRLLRGRLQAQKEGYYIGSTLPFGFDKERGEKGFILIPNEETEYVRTIFNLFVYENYSTAEIITFLNDNGIKAKYHSEWTYQSIRRILSNKVYLGYIRVGARKGDISYFKGKHNPVVDEDVFYKAQEKLKIKSVKNKKSCDIVNPLSSLVKCSVCGITMQKAGLKFRCNRVGCSTVMSYFEDVEKLVIEELKNELKNFNCFIENYGEELEKEAKLKEQKLALLNKELVKKDKMIDRACEMLELGVYSKEKYLSRVSVLEEEKANITANMAELMASAQSDTAKIRRAIPILENVLDEYWNFNARDKNDLLKSIIDKIEYTKTKYNTRWNKSLDDLQLKIFLKI